MKKKKHFLSMILGLALSLTILFPSFAQASEILVQYTIVSYEILALVLKITLLLMNYTTFYLDSTHKYSLGSTYVEYIF